MCAHCPVFSWDRVAFFSEEEILRNMYVHIHSYISIFYRDIDPGERFYGFFLASLPKMSLMSGQCVSSSLRDPRALRPTMWLHPSS